MPVSAHGSSKSSHFASQLRQGSRRRSPLPSAIAEPTDMPAGSQTESQLSQSRAREQQKKIRKTQGKWRESICTNELGKWRRRGFELTREGESGCESRLD
ncbi:hypothetical protein BHE74_00044023 [Ensete ventricosum]|nr:hypothetical protein BHE74_00044023 [Ensete ventricosum]RZR85434.1 hypothetical protein BHM03_00012405 [Ensete ventricosum]